LTVIQLLFLNVPVVVTLWLLLWFFGLCLTIWFIDTENPLYAAMLNSVERIRELYEMGVVCAFAVLAASTIS
jgi:uncharacterized membrane protein